jgi:2'-5' RNA ligase
MTEEATFYSETWRRFLKQAKVRSAFTGATFENWTPDRRYLSILVDLSSALVLTSTAATIATAMNCPAYGLVGPDGLHLTVQEIGFADKLDATDLVALKQDVARVAADTACFRTAVSGVGSFADAAFFQVEPWEPFQAIRRKLWDACPTLRGRGPSADLPAMEGGFAPHISIAYYNDTAPTTAIAECLAQFRELRLPAFEAPALSLVGVRHPIRAYFQWEVLERFAFGSQG